MAEIEIGTLNSPEISLFLNASNNLEVQDSDGNVIATFKQDQSSEFSSVNTDSGLFNDAFRLNDEFKQISSNEVNYTTPIIELGAESGSSDDLDNMRNASAGAIAILKRSGSDTITVRHNQGSSDRFFLDGGTNKLLDSNTDRLTLLYDGSDWMQIAFSNPA